MKEEPLEPITQKILWIIRKYSNQLYSTESDNLEEMEKLPRNTQFTKLKS